MQASYSMLTLKIREALDLALYSELPSVIYRDFSEQSHRDNFVSGNIWFSGPNQNRFLLEDEARRDIWEYRNCIGSHIFEYSLSFTTAVPSNNKPAIAIYDIDGFFAAVKADLENKKSDKAHSVTWLRISDLQQYQSLLPIIRVIKQYPRYDGETVGLYMQGLGGAPVIYEEKMKALGGSYDGIKVANNARHKNSNHAHENEWRMWLNTGDFLPPYGGGLQNLVQYLKLSSPSIKRYCEIIN